MLTNLHVKNLALIDEIDIEFGEGLNILTGETGAGKSILLGSINIALGGKCNADIIRKGTEYALTELVFHITDDSIIDALKQLEVEDVESGEIIISRKITPVRSQIKVNGMTFTAAQVRQIAAMLIDIHGQHDNRLLLKENSHLEMTDSYAQHEIALVLQEYKLLYNAYNDMKARLDGLQTDAEARLRELSFVEYEIKEIEAARLVNGEDEEMEAAFRKISNSQKIITELNNATQLLRDGDENICDMMSGVVKSCINASQYDDKMAQIVNELQVAYDMLTNISRELVDAAMECEYDEGDYQSVKERLDLINSFKLKYGKSIEEILAYYERQQKRYEELYDYDNIVNNLKKKLSELENELGAKADELTCIRKKAAKELCQNVSVHLKKLNFMNNEFEAEFTQKNEFTSNGRDNMRFMISTNVGQELMPLSKIASGGELSRIMLAVKCCMAESENRQSLIFDEIDAGISGRTAQLVANNLNMLARVHQIICITHLPQIAAMADRHFLIDKYVKENNTYTSITALDDDKSVEELSRMLGGSELTEAVRKNAIEMKALAKKDK